MKARALRILLSPTLLAIPLTALALALVLIPFVVWNVDHAAQFYGSFFAAFIAAAAAFSGYVIQDKLKDEQNEREKREKHKSDLVDLYFWLRHMDRRLNYAMGMIERKLGEIKQPKGDKEAFFDLNDIEKKDFAFGDISSETRIRVHIALSIPGELGITIAENMYEVCDLSDDLKIAVSIEPGGKVTLNNLLGMKNIIHKRQKNIQDSAKEVKARLDVQILTA
jgi:hypothetical protein